jgi:hypothetical protein
MTFTVLNPSVVMVSPAMRLVAQGKRADSPRARQPSRVSAHHSATLGRAGVARL